MPGYWPKLLGQLDTPPATDEVSESSTCLLTLVPAPLSPDTLGVRLGLRSSRINNVQCLLALIGQYFAEVSIQILCPLLKSDCLADLKQFFIVSPILQRSFPLRVSSTAKSFHFHVVQFTYFFFWLFLLLVSHLRKHGLKSKAMKTYCCSLL